MRSAVGWRGCAVVVAGLLTSSAGLLSAMAQSEPSLPSPAAVAPTAPEPAEAELAAPVQEPPSPVRPPRPARINRGLLTGGIVLAGIGLALLIPGAVVAHKPENQTPDGALQRDLVGVPLQIAGGVSLGIGGLAILYGVAGSAAQD